jgi:glycine dehydrogenase
MKLNPTSFMIPVTYPGFSKLHPYSPRECTRGYDLMIENMTNWLCNVTGFAGMSL